MSNQHKHPTISFRISDAERKQIEARILASGMMKKDYFAIKDLHIEYTNMLTAIIDLLDGAKYLLEGDCHEQ